jgi:mono/diheme cytochrome c family protein
MRHAIPWLVCGWLFFGGMVAGSCLAAVGAETDPRTITDLPAAEAKRLAGEHRGKLSLDALTTLSDDAAKELANREGFLALNGLKTLSNGAAAALGTHKGYLYLDGLTTLSDEAAAELAKHGGYLSLDGITTLSDAAQATLLKTGGAAGHLGTRGGLSLRGLTTLSPAGASVLAARRGIEVMLDGLTTLTPETYEILATVHPHTWQPNLPRLTAVSEDLARAMSKRPPALPGLRELPLPVATALGNVNGNLPGLQSLTPEVAELVVKSARQGINLDGLTTLTEDLAKVLAKTNGSLSLNGVKTLPDAVAEALGKVGVPLLLNGLEQISPTAVGKLGANPNVRSPVFLEGLKTLTDETANALAASPRWTGGLPRLTEVSEKVASALASSRAWNGALPGVKSLSAAAAKALAARSGNLTLDGLDTLPDDVATALAGHRGGTLSLDGLKTLSDGAAAAISAHAGRLSLAGLPTLSAAAAKSLAAHAGDWLTLDGVKTLPPEAAKALAGARGVVSLTGLEPGKEDVLTILRPAAQVILPAGARRVAAAAVAAAADEKAVHAFLGRHCGECHGEDAEEIQGSFAIDKPWPTMADIGGRVAYASVIERLRAGDMPPPSVKQRPDAAETARVMSWIAAQLDTPLPGPATPYAVKDKPVDGNRLPHAILFGGPRGPSVPPPPRLWRLSPQAYSAWTGNFQNSNVNQQPFGLIAEAGIKDYAALYSPDEGASGLLLANAELIVKSQSARNPVVNIKEKPEAAKNAWPSEARFQACSPAEQKALADGLRVGGGGAFAPILHPQVAATRAELETAVAQQFAIAIARPPVAAEVESLVKLYETVAAHGDHRLAGEIILMAPLLNPEAVLRFEVGTGAEVRPGVRMLSPREIAQAVSLALGVRLEPGLAQAAAGGGLTTREDVAAHVRRILDTPKIGKPQIMRFFREYFGYDNAPGVFKDPPMNKRHFSPAGMVNTTDARVMDVLGEDRHVLERLLTGDEMYSVAELQQSILRGALHGGEGPLLRTVPPHAVSLTKGPVEGRIGVLMDSAWLVAWSTNFHNDPVRRGRWIRERLLGGRVPDLPINAAAMIPDDPHRTLRERQSVTRDAACWKCHYRMDDLGLPFEAYDHYGWAQAGEPVVDLEATEKAKGTKVFRNAPLDTTGLIAHSGDPELDGPVADAPEMLRRLARSERVRQVFIRHAFRFFMGRNETPGDAPSLQEADRAYIESDGSFRAVVVALLSSEAFLCRSVGTAAAGDAGKTARR